MIVEKLSSQKEVGLPNFFILRFSFVESCGKVYAKQIMQHQKLQRAGVKINELNIDSINYADYKMVIARIPQELRVTHSSQAFNEEGLKYNKKINTKKQKS